jgi:hypothetical protein
LGRNRSVAPRAGPRWCHQASRAVHRCRLSWFVLRFFKGTIRTTRSTPQQISHLLRGNGLFLVFLGPFSPCFSLDFSGCGSLRVLFSGWEDRIYPIRGSLLAATPPQRITETIVFAAGQFVFTFTPQLPNGSVGTPVSFGWDCVANRKL